MPFLKSKELQILHHIKQSTCGVHLRISNEQREIEKWHSCLWLLNLRDVFLFSLINVNSLDSALASFLDEERDLQNDTGKSKQKHGDHSLKQTRNTQFPSLIKMCIRCIGILQHFGLIFDSKQWLFSGERSQMTMQAHTWWRSNLWFIHKIDWFKCMRAVHTVYCIRCVRTVYQTRFICIT